MTSHPFPHVEVKILTFCPVPFDSMNIRYFAFGSKVWIFNESGFFFFSLPAEERKKKNIRPATERHGHLVAVTRRTVARSSAWLFFFSYIPLCLEEHYYSCFGLSGVSVVAWLVNYTCFGFWRAHIWFRGVLYITAHDNFWVPERAFS